MILYDQRDFWIKLNNFLNRKKKEKQKLGLNVHIPIFHNLKFLQKQHQPVNAFKLKMMASQSRIGIKQDVTFPEIVR